MIAVISANTATYSRVPASAERSERDLRIIPTMSRSALEAITRSTLSSDDMAAATMASRRKALAPAEKTPGVVRS